MRIRHVMTKDPRCCLPWDSAAKAASIMREEHAGVVPVIESEQCRRVIGVVTDRDLCMNVVAEGRDPHETKVDACMTSKVVTCSPNDSVERVTELMRENQIRRVPVVLESRELQGIVSLGDVVERATVKSTQTHDTLKGVSAPTDIPSKPRADSKKAA
jgi:CBS domain-containing protein